MALSLPELSSAITRISTGAVPEGGSAVVMPVFGSTLIQLGKREPSANSPLNVSARSTASSAILTSISSPLTSRSITRMLPETSCEVLVVVFIQLSALSPASAANPDVISSPIETVDGLASLIGISPSLRGFTLRTFGRS